MTIEKPVPDAAVKVIEYLETLGGNWKTFVQGINTCNHPLKIVETKNAVQKQHEYKPGELEDGILKISKHLHRNEYSKALKDVGDAISHSNDVGMREKLLGAINRGVTPVTYSDVINRRKVEDYRFLKKGYDKEGESSDWMHKAERIAEGTRWPGSYIETSSGASKREKKHLKEFINAAGTTKRLSTKAVNFFEKADATKSPGWSIVVQLLRDWLEAGDGTSCEIMWNPNQTYSYHVDPEDSSTHSVVGSDTILVHELVHAYHFLNGRALFAPAMEEAQTIGFFPFDHDPYTENKYRPFAQGQKYRPAYRVVYDFEETE